MLQNVLHKYGLSLPGHLALRSRLVMGADNSLDFLQVGRWQISGDGVLYSSRSIAESNCLGTVAACTEQPVKSSGYIGVAAANPVHHLNIPIRLFLIVLILCSIVYHRAKGVAFGAVDDSLGGGYDGDGEGFSGYIPWPGPLSTDSP